MTGPIKKRSRKAGLPPGTLIHIGEQKSATTRITLLQYNEHDAAEKNIESIDDGLALRDPAQVKWINVAGLHQVELLAKLGKTFGLHPLVLEDILNTDQRPKLEDYGDYAYIVLKRLGNGNADGEITTEQVSLILAPNLVISFQEAESNIFDGVKERILGNRGRIRTLGADYLTYRLLDAVVDNYFAIFEKLGERVESLQDQLLTNPTPKSLQVLHHLKRELLYLRKSVWPLREVIGGLQREESPLIARDTTIYFRDVYDHTIHVIDTLETYRDMLAGMLDIYLSSLSYRMNEVMKVLTVIATIFMPLTFIVGLYGMNFKYMPELEWRWGYFGVLLLMVVVSAIMLIYFRRKKWL